MDTNRSMPSTQPVSMADQALERVGESIRKRILQELPACTSDEEPLLISTDLDRSTHPPSRELRIENTFALSCLYDDLSTYRKSEFFHAIRSAAGYAIAKDEPQQEHVERDSTVFVFKDQSAVELAHGLHRSKDPFYLPTLRAISWQFPALLVGDKDQSTEMNLFRLGYQVAVQTGHTSLYRHVDPAMPLVGHSFSAKQHHITLFQSGQPPRTLSIPENEQGRGQLVDLREPQVDKTLKLVKASAPADESKIEVGNTRYPATLLAHAANQFGLQLTTEDAKRLLNGQKTDVVVTANGSTGKLYVLNTPGQGPQLVMQDVRRELILKESYLGHAFTDKDKQNLLKYGDMGRAIDLIDKQSGQKFIGFVGVDKDTKTLTVLRADQIRPKIERMSHLKGVSLTGLQKQRLLEGKAIRLDNMTSKAGTSFSAYVRVSAAGRTLRFDHIPTGQAQKSNFAAKEATSIVPNDADPHKPKRKTRPVGSKPKP